MYKKFWQYTPTGTSKLRRALKLETPEQDQHVARYTYALLVTLLCTATPLIHYLGMQTNSETLHLISAITSMMLIVGLLVSNLALMIALERDYPYGERPHQTTHGAYQFIQNTSFHIVTYTIFWGLHYNIVNIQETQELNTLGMMIHAGIILLLTLRRITIRQRRKAWYPPNQKLLEKLQN